MRKLEVIRKLASRVTSEKDIYHLGDKIPYEFYPEGAVKKPGCRATTIPIWEYDEKMDTDRLIGVRIEYAFPYGEGYETGHEDFYVPFPKLK